MKVKQGDVIIGPDFIRGNNRRPFVVINNEEHPFSGEECSCFSRNEGRGTASR